MQYIFRKAMVVVALFVGLGGAGLIFGFEIHDDLRSRACDIELGEFSYPYKLIDNTNTVIDVGLYAVQEFVDIDNDGDYDLFIGEWWGEIWFYRNDGTSYDPSYTFVTNSFESINVGRSAAPKFADIDNDGDYDLFIGNNFTVGYGAGNLWYYENVGTPESPSFQLVSNSYLTLVNTGISKPDFVDIDDDGDLDLFFGYEKSFPDGERGVVYYRNDGTPSIPDWTLVTTDYNGLSGSGTFYFYFPDFVDADCDGDFDMLLGTHYKYIKYYRNDGDATNPSWTHITNDFGDLSYHLKGYYNVPQLFDLNNDAFYDMSVGVGHLQHNEDEEGVIQVFLGPVSLCGDANCDGGLNLSDAVYLIDYIFLNGAPPSPFDIADANCDTKINLVDIIYIVSYIYRGGYAPCDIDGDDLPDC